MRARGSSDDVLQRLGCTVTAVGLELPPNLSYEEWLAVACELGKEQGTLFWCIGDLWVYGEHRYGDRKALIESEEWQDLMGFAYSTCAHAAAAVRAFPESCRRRQRLTPSHHLEVASLPPRLADELLDLATTGKWSVRALREEKRRRIALLVPRATDSAEPAKAVVLKIVPAPEPETSDYALFPIPGDPRLEPEARYEPEPSPAEVQRRKIGQAKAGLRHVAAQLADATPQTLLLIRQEIKLLQAEVTKQLRQSDGGRGDTVVNFR
jgi:hypothetical protein